MTPHSNDEEQAAISFDLTVMLLEAGILQFGRFARGATWEPCRFNFHLLPSYPHVLKRIIEHSGTLVGEVDHLICTVSNLPFGVGLSLQVGIPLVYSRETNVAPVYDLIGAYDIGHPALLLAYRASEIAEHQTLIEQARRVGLEITRSLVLVDEGFSAGNNLEITALLHLPSIVETLLQSGLLPRGQGQIINGWISSHHPS